MTWIDWLLVVTAFSPVVVLAGLCVVSWRHRRAERAEQGINPKRFLGDNE